MTSTTDSSTAKVYRIDGWDPPVWAAGPDHHRLDEAAITWQRDGAPIVDSGAPHERVVCPSLMRCDSIEFDPAGGTLTLMQGDVGVSLGQIEEVSPAEARRLAATLVELADLAEGVTR